jgi:outer membrane protein, heavy metal efflux system
MYRTLIIILQIILLQPFFLQGQNDIGTVLEEIERNNTTIQAHRKQMEAQSLYNRTGNNLPNPEFDYSLFWGNPSAIGNKTDISLRQHFDFPTAYRHRANISQARNQQLMSEYQEQRHEILLQARLLCLELIFVNAMAREYDFRMGHARQIAVAYETMLQQGHTTIIEYNKARLNLLNIQNEAENNTIRKEHLQNRLSAMNGGIDIFLSQDEFDPLFLPSDFDLWYEEVYQRNPILQWLQQETEISEKQLRLQRAVNLPSFNAGYVSETLMDEQFRGFAVGLTIPMFENRNTLKYAQANILAAEAMVYNSNVQYYRHMRASYERALSLQRSVEEYRSVAQTLDNTELLSTAHSQGQMSLTAYILELTFIYQSIDRILEMELDLQMAVAEMYKYGR